MSVLTRWFRSGVEDQLRLAAQVGKPLSSDAATFRRRQDEEQEAGEACNYALYADEAASDKPAPPQPPQSAWVVPVSAAGASTVISAAGAIVVALLFNTHTVSGSTVDTGALLLIPVALMAMKLAGIAHKVGRIGELRAMSEAASRKRGYATIATFLTAVGWGMARSTPMMGDTAAGLANGCMWLLELSLGWASSESAALLCVHLRPPTHFGAARKFQRLADAAEVITGVVGVGTASSNGAGAARRAPERRTPTGVHNGS